MLLMQCLVKIEEGVAVIDLGGQNESEIQNLRQEISRLREENLELKLRQPASIIQHQIELDHGMNRFLEFLQQPYTRTLFYVNTFRKNCLKQGTRGCKSMSVEEITGYINLEIKDPQDHVAPADVYNILHKIHHLQFRKAGKTHYLDNHVVIPSVDSTSFQLPVQAVTSAVSKSELQEELARVKQEAKIAELEQRLTQTSLKTSEFIDPRQEFQLGIVKMFVQEKLELNPTARAPLDEIKNSLLLYAKDRGCDINYKEVPGLLLKAAGLKRKESNGKTYYEGCRMKEVQPYIQDIKRVALDWDGKKSRTLDVLQGYCGEGPLNEGIPASKYGLLVDICTGGRVPRHEVKSIMEELGYEQKRWGKNMCYMGLRFAHPEINACENTKEALKEALMSIRRDRSANLNGLYNPVSSTSPSSAASSPMSPSGYPQNSTISSQIPVVSLGKN
jgi:hypothetical protein